VQEELILIPLIKIDAFDRFDDSGLRNMRIAAKRRAGKNALLIKSFATGWLPWLTLTGDERQYYSSMESIPLPTTVGSEPTRSRVS